MKNDLTDFEKSLLFIINQTYNKKYNYKNLMEWSSNKHTVDKNLQEGEIIYNVMSVFVTINPSKK